MSTGFIGADLDALREMSKTFATASHDLGAVRLRIQLMVIGTEWAGGDFKRFADCWHANAKALSQVAHALDVAGKDLLTELGEQREASGMKARNPGSVLDKILHDVEDAVTGAVKDGVDAVEGAVHAVEKAVDHLVTDPLGALHDIVKGINDWKEGTVVGSFVSNLPVVGDVFSVMDGLEGMLDPSNTDADKAKNFYGSLFKLAGDGAMFVGGVAIGVALVATAPVSAPTIAVLVGGGAAVALAGHLMTDPSPQEAVIGTIEDGVKSVFGGMLTGVGAGLGAGASAAAGSGIASKVVTQEVIESSVGGAIDTVTNGFNSFISQKDFSWF